MEQVEVNDLDIPTVSALSNVFENMQYEPVFLPENSTLNDYFHKLDWPEGSQDFAVMFVNGLREENWSRVVMPGDDVKFLVLPGGGDSGGKQALALVAMIAVMVLSRGVASGAIGGLFESGVAGASFAGITGATAGSFAAGMAISVVGSLLIGAVFKPSISSNNNMDGMSAESDPFGPSAMITGQSNRANIGGVIPKLYGAHKIYPDLAAVPYVVKSGCRQTLHALYSAGYGYAYADPHTAEFGGIPISQLNGLVKVQVTQLGENIGSLPTAEYYEGLHTSENIGFTLPLMTGDLNDPGYVESISKIVQPAEGASSCYLDFIFPGGLFTTDTYGNVQGHRASIVIEKGSLGEGWTKIINADVAGDGVVTCRDGNPGQQNIDGAVLEKDYVEQWWGEIHEVVDGGGVGKTVNLVNPALEMFRPVGDGGNGLPAVNSWGIWNSGEGEGNTGSDSLKNVWLSWQPAGLGGGLYMGARDTLGDPFNIHYIVYPQSGGTFLAGTYECAIYVSNPQIQDDPGVNGPHVEDAYRTATNVTGLMWASSLNPGVGAYSALTQLYPSKQSTVLHCSFTLTADKTGLGGIRVGFTVDSGKTSDTSWLNQRHRITMDRMICNFTPEVEDVGDVRPVVRIGVKNTIDVDPEKVQNVPAPGSLFYTAASVECNSTPEPEYKGVGNTCLKKTSPGFTVIGTPILLGTDESEKVNLYEITLDGPIDAYDSSYYINESIYEDGFHVYGETRNPLHFGINLKVSLGTQFRIYKASPTPAVAVDGVVLNALNSSAPGNPVKVPYNSGNLLYGLIGLSAKADNVVGQQLKPFSIHAWGLSRSFSLTEGHYNNDLNFGDNTATHSDFFGNPAWAYINVLMGNAADRPLNVRGTDYLGDFIDLEAFDRWANFCEDKDLSFNLIVDSVTTIAELLQTIASVGMAIPTRPDGKYSILFEGDPENYDTDPVTGKFIPRSTQLITPENSWGLEASINYVKKTHALKMRYLPKYKTKEVVTVVYQEGFAETGSDYENENSSSPWKATIFETISLPGVTDGNHAGLLGQYYLKQATLRREYLSLSMDVENLISLEGDVVSVAHDVLKMGGQVAYVISWFDSGGSIYVTLNEPIPYNPGTIGIRFRYMDGDTPRLTDIIPAFIPDEEDPTEILYNNNHGSPVDGSMLVWGTIESVTRDYQITNIKYSSDLTAKLEMLEYIPEIWNAEYRDPGGETPTDGFVAPPNGVFLTMEWEFTGGVWTFRYVVTWFDSPGITGVGGIYRVNFTGAQPNQIVTDVSNYTGNWQTFNPDVLEMKVCVTAVDLYGNESEPACYLAYYNCPGSAPAKVPELNSNSRGDHIELSWTKPYVEDPKGYIVKWMTEDEYNALPLLNGVPYVTVADGHDIPGLSDELIPYETTNLTVSETVTSTGLVYCIWAYSACGYTSALAAVTVLDHYLVGGVIPEADISLWPDVTTGATLVNVEQHTLGGGENTLILSKDGNGHYYSEGWLLSEHYEDYGTQTALVTLLSTIGMGEELAHEWLLEEMIPLAIAKPLSGKAAFDPETRFAEIYTWKNPVFLTTGTVADLLDPVNDASRNLLKTNSINANKIYYGIRLVTDRANVTPVLLNASVERKYTQRTIGGSDVSLTVTKGSTTLTRVTFDCEFINVSTGFIPQISVTNENLDGVIIWDIINRDHTGFDVRVINSNITDLNATFDWTATGFGKYCP